jgi:pyridoxamine 5'-phosphate oxidase
MNTELAQSWRTTLLDSLQVNNSKAGSRYLQLATLDVDGYPAVRTVVFRGFLEGTDILLIHTDIRSGKVAQLTKQPNVQLCWYFSDTREQYRISGKVELVDENSTQWQQQRISQWQALSSSAKAAYFWSEPGAILALDDRNQPMLQIQEDELAVCQNFMLVLIHPKSVDHLQLKPTPHKRLSYQLVDNQWSKNALNP